MLWHFHGFGEEKTAYCTASFSKFCQFGWPYSLAKVGGPRQEASLSSGVARSVVRICLGSDHWNCESKWGTLNLHAVHLNINKYDNIGVLCCVDFFVCLVIVPIRRNYFVISVVNLPKYRRQNPLPLHWKRRMNYIFAVKLGVRGTDGHQIHVKVDVRDIYVADSLALTNQNLPQSLWCGENSRIILPYATFVQQQ